MANEQKMGEGETHFPKRSNSGGLLSSLFAVGETMRGGRGRGKMLRRPTRGHYTGWSRSPLSEPQASNDLSSTQALHSV